MTSYILSKNTKNYETAAILKKCRKLELSRVGKRLFCKLWVVGGLGAVCKCACCVSGKLNKNVRWEK
jgi:hypothetical protein